MRCWRMVRERTRAVNILRFCVCCGSEGRLYNSMMFDG
jgi:hypothetical protein